MLDGGIRVRLNALDDHDLLVRNSILLEELVLQQKACNLACIVRLNNMEARFSKYDKLEGWMKGLWLVTGGVVIPLLLAILVAGINFLWRTKGG